MMRNRIIIIGFFILNKFFIHRCCSQNFNSEDLFELNTTVSISDYYIKRNEYVCSLKAIKNLNARLYNKMNLLYLANVYLLNKENDSMESCILRHFSQNGNILDLPQLNDKNSPYFLVYSKNREYFDSLFFSYSNSPKYFSSKTIDDQLNIMIAEDQFVRKNNALFCISEKIISPILSIDSINTIKLLTLIKYDSCCNLTIERFPSLFTLYIHLTRYDISVYNEILSHVNKCQNGYSKPIYCAMLTDNRLRHFNKTEQYYTFSFKSNQPNLDFKRIDEDRRSIGLESLFFSFLRNNIKMPDFYQNYHTKYINCNEE